MRARLISLLLWSTALSADYRPVPVTERYPLADMQYQGTIAADSALGDTGAKQPLVYALVKLPNGEVHRLKPFDTLGTHYGQIINIEPERLYVAEILPGCREPRSWHQRMNYLDSPATLFNPEYRLRTAACLDAGDIAVADERLTCAENHCAIEFTLHNRLHHPVDVSYTIEAGHDTESGKGNENSKPVVSCDDVQRLEANQRLAVKKYIRTAAGVNAVTITPAFGAGEVPAGNRCLDAGN